MCEKSIKDILGSLESLVIGIGEVDTRENLLQTGSYISMERQRGPPTSCQCDTHYIHWPQRQRLPILLLY